MAAVAEAGGQVPMAWFEMRAVPAGAVAVPSAEVMPSPTAAPAVVASRMRKTPAVISMHVAIVKSPPERRGKAMETRTAVRCGTNLSEGDSEQCHGSDNKEISR
jgi:hypothetical protein